MIQGGGYIVKDNTLMEAPELTPIKGEFKSNGVENNLKHELGVISMARTNIKDSATSQFFVCSANTPWLDGEYAAFGKTTDEESKKVVVEISKMPKGMLSPAFQDFPYELIYIEEVLISEEKFNG
jgi:peptidyl-prolyl cis-trans isomerase B (cyclophilin B)